MAFQRLGCIVLLGCVLLSVLSMVTVRAQDPVGHTPKNMQGPQNVKQPPNTFVEFVSDSDSQAFMDWATRWNITHNIRLAMLRTASGELLRGAVAARDLEDGDVIVEVPEQGIITPAVAKAHPVLGRVFSDTNVSWRDEMIIVLFLLYESNNAESIYKPYLKLFMEAPVEHMTPMWSLNQIEAGPPLLRTETFAKLHRIAAQHGHLFPYLFHRYPEVFPASKRHHFAYKPYKDMSQLAASRWWYLPVHGHSTSLIVPLADMVNFGNAYSTCGFDDGSKSFKMTARQPFKTGEEVLFWYTNDCEDLIQLHYGFTHADVSKCAGSSVEDTSTGIDLDAEEAKENDA
jgi:hypothetical protein